MIVNKQSIQSLFVGLKTIFNKALLAQTGDWQDTTMVIPSTGSEEDYAWLSRFPKFRKWVGEKVVKSLKAFKYTAVNEDYETTIEVDRNNVEDGKLASKNLEAQTAGDSAGELNDIISDSLKNDAFTKPCMDGQYYYDTDHPVGKTTVSNKLTVVLSAANRAAADASIGLARTMISNFKDEEGMSLRLKGDTLEVPTALFPIANTLATSKELDDGTNNPYQNTFKVKENPGLDSDTQWMLHVTKKPIKPFIIQERKKPTFVSQTSMDSDDVFLRRKFKFGAEARATGLYGFWQLSVGSTGTV